MSVSSREERVLQIIETARAKRPRFKDKQITLAHGAGGKATQTLIEGLLVPAFTHSGTPRGGAQAGGGDALGELGDAGRISLGADADPTAPALAMTSDSFVVSPLRFAGGSIGELAVNGTVNDLAMAGAKARALTVSMILEEGLPAEILREEVQAIALAATAAGVEIVGGDTKVVPRGLADGMYLCTTGVGVVDPRASLSPRGLRPGDQIIVSGPIGEHGTAIMLARNQFDLDAEMESDTCCLWPAVEALLDAAADELHCLRDATRGGVASVLNELARASHVGVVVHEADVPVHPVVAAAAELLGIDPMYLANEGRLVAAVGPDGAEAALVALQGVPGCAQAAVIGEVAEEPPGMVLVATAFGGRRVMDQLVGDPLPRIC